MRLQVGRHLVFLCLAALVIAAGSVRAADLVIPASGNPEHVLKQLAKQGLNGQPMAIVLVEQYYDFAEELADRYLVMERGEVIASGSGAEMVEKGIRQLVAI